MRRGEWPVRVITADNTGPWSNRSSLHTPISVLSQIISNLCESVPSLSRPVSQMMSRRLRHASPTHASVPRRTRGVRVYISGSVLQSREEPDLPCSAAPSRPPGPPCLPSRVLLLQAGGKKTSSPGCPAQDPTRQGCPPSVWVFGESRPNLFQHFVTSWSGEVGSRLRLLSVLRSRLSR